MRVMDWKQIIAEIHRHGYKQAQIADKCHCAQSTISELASGNTENPSYALGERLTELLGKCRAKKREGPSNQRVRKNKSGKRQ